MGNTKSKRREFVTTNTLSIKLIPTPPQPSGSESIECQTETFPQQRPSIPPAPIAHNAEVLSSPRAESYSGSVASLRSSNANVSHVNVQEGGGESQHVTSQVYSNQMSGIIQPQPSSEARATFLLPERPRQNIFQTN